MAEPVLKRPTFAPRNWGGWLMAGFIWGLGHMPRRLGLAVVYPLGPLLRWGMTSRRRIAERNLAACFPEKSNAERQAILKESFHSLARMLAETAWCWAIRDRNMDAVGQIVGREHMEEALAAGHGILAVTAHITCLEMGAKILGERVIGKGLYRPLNNEVMEWYQNRGRRQYAGGMISKRDIRGAIRFLRDDGYLWYAPDQDFGAAQSLFAPFFGISTASLLATHRLPAMTGARVLTMFPRYDRKTGRYVVEFTPMLENYPSDDPQADLARINAILEQQVRRAPEQYWWIHRRFKTRPEGEPPFYE